MNNVNVITTKKFRREAKKYLKKYPSLKRELEELNKLLKVEPIQGVKLTENTYKIRISVKSKNKGKSGGLRIISFIYVKMPKKDETINVYLLDMYSKSDRQNIPNNVLTALIEAIKKDIL